MKSAGVGLRAGVLLATLRAQSYLSCLLLYGCDHACWRSGDDEARGERGEGQQSAGLCEHGGLVYGFVLRLCSAGVIAVGAISVRVRTRKVGSVGNE